MKKSGASFQTPKQTKATPAIQSEQNRDAKKNKNKRKSLPANLTNGDGDTSPKKPKIDAFSGTTDLFMQMKKTPEGKAVKKADNVKSAGKQNKKPEKQNESSPKSEEALGVRAKRRKERLLARRAAGKERLKQTLTQVSSGDKSAITQLKEHLTQLLQKPTLSKSGKRKAKQLKKALKIAGIDVSGFTISQVTTVTNVEKPKLQAGNQKIKQKDNAGNKKESAAPGKKNVQPQKKQIVTKEEDSDEDEESESGEDDIKAQISALKTSQDESDEEEDDDSDDQDDSFMQAEAESDDDEDDDDDDEEEEEDSDENDDVPAKNPKLGKKNQNNDTKALSMHHTNLKGRRINVQYSQGGKKKGDDKKKEIKAKNFKLQAMRQEGKLSGSVKQSQKRAARREKRKGANKAN